MKRECRVAMIAVACGVLVSDVMSREPLARLELASYQQLSSDIVSLSAHVQQPMLNMGLMAFGNLLGSPGLLGIDQTQPIQLAVFAEDGDWTKAERVMVLPLAGEGQDYLNSLMVSYELLREDGLTRRFRANRNVQSFREMSVRILNGRAVVSPSAPLVQQVVEMLEEDAEALSVGGISGTVRGFVQMSAVIPALRRQLDETARAADAMGAEAEDPAAAAVAEAQRIYADTLLEVLEQTQATGVGFQCNEQGMTIFARLDVLPETIAAKILAESVPPSERLVRLLPPDASLVYASGMLGAFMRHGMDPYMAFADKLMQAQMTLLEAMTGDKGGTPEVDFQELSAQLKELQVGYGDEFVLSLGGAAGENSNFVFFEAMTVTKEQKFLESLGASLDLANESYAKMKIPIRFERREDRDAGGLAVQVYGMRFVPPAADAVDGDPAAAEAPEAEGEHRPEAAADGGDPEAREEAPEDFERMFWKALPEQMAWLEKGVMELTVSEGVMLLALGSSGCLDPFVERLRNPPADTWTARSKALFPEIKNHDKSSEFWILRPFELVKGLVPLFDPDGDAAEMVAQLPDDGNGIGGLTMTSATAAMGALRISASSLGAFAKSVATMQRAAMQRAATTARPRMPPPGNPVEVVLPED